MPTINSVLSKDYLDMQFVYNLQSTILYFKYIYIYI